MQRDTLANQYQNNHAVLESLWRNGVNGNNPDSGSIRSLVKQNPTLAFHWLRSKEQTSGNKLHLDEEIKKTWQEQVLQNCEEPIINRNDWLLDLKTLIENPPIDLNLLPPFSFCLQFQIRLSQPYLSKDEAAFYIIDNPIRREKILQIPYMASTSWKGALRAAMRMDDVSQDAEYRLFGNPKDAEEDDFLAGRLHFFGSYFNHVGLEIINPHDPIRKVGEKPILMECVPEGNTAWFTVLYAPLEDDPGGDLKTLCQQLDQDLQALRQGLKVLFLESGFGAKTSSGFGLAEVLGGALAMRIEVSRFGQPALKPPEEVIAFWEEYGEDDFSLRPQDWRRRNNRNNLDRDRYQNARERWLEYQQALTQASGLWWQSGFERLSGEGKTLEASIDEARAGLAHLVEQEAIS